MIIILLCHSRADGNLVMDGRSPTHHVYVIRWIDKSNPLL